MINKNFNFDWQRNFVFVDYKLFDKKILSIDHFFFKIFNSTFILKRERKEREGEFSCWAYWSPIKFILLEDRSEDIGKDICISTYEDHIPCPFQIFLMMTVTSSPHDHIVILVNLTCRIRLSSFINLISLSNTETLIRITISLLKYHTIFNYYTIIKNNNNADILHFYMI